VSLHGKKDHVKKAEKGDAMTRFWYTLKNLDLEWMKIGNINMTLWLYSCNGIA
jgi:hypothetical protein